MVWPAFQEALASQSFTSFVSKQLPRAESAFFYGLKELFVFDLGMDYFSDQQSDDDAADQDDVALACVLLIPPGGNRFR